MAEAPSFTIGIEEEYLLVHQDTYELATAPEGLIEACDEGLDGQVSPEFLQCQVEVGTKVCQTVTEAREDLGRLRARVAGHAADFGLRPIAVSCHPTADWHSQVFTNKERYRALERDLAGVAHRMLICGMHVHVGIEDEALRIDLMNQFMYFLPHLLALSASSPFWKGQDTGLASYRLTVFDNLPRTGLPPRFVSWAEYERSVQMIVDTGAIEDATKIWWDVRPSARFPTLEARICDVCPRIDDTVALAALVQCTLRMLWRLSRVNQRWRIYDAFLVGENRWRAQRYGTQEGLIDFARGCVVPFAELLEELLALIAEDAAALGCTAEVAHAREILARGTSATQQRAAFYAARKAGADDAEAFRTVLRGLAADFTRTQ
ncbi:MAG: carboxylate-amine ligase [Rhodobacteraceae bacterium]|jgi:carboxylate-amine ligase|nr:carboxylate-amine ligase [Paracoccaceae bacterium]MBL4558640.1 carboxylate-amine ligase [Paracoccaceae bacterium]HBG97674.1 carboxylate-amine ligase [Paracoccaceae bacterium]